MLSLVSVALQIGGLGGEIRLGSWLSLASAVALTVQVLALSRLAVRATPLEITAAESLGAVVVLSGMLVIHGGSSLAVLGHAFAWPAGVWAGVLCLALGGGLWAFMLQAWGQRHISATAAALAFNTEAVWSALPAWLILAETLSRPRGRWWARR
ncbi:MAG: EamA family transporter [Thermaerobacter sp.]|nr:EamA family transporter [Thermaerobacter sp.]